MGGKALTIEFEKPCFGNGDCLEDGDKLASESLGLMASMLGDGAIDGAMESAQMKIQEMMGSGDGNMQGDFSIIMSDLKVSVANLNDITTKINKVLASSAYDVKNVSSNLSKLSNTLNDNNQRIESILMNVESVTNDLKSANVSGVVASANTTMTSANDAISDIKKTIATTNESMAKITEIVEKVENGEGSLGLLINDKELYKELENTSEEIGLLLQDVRLNPKRYINVSVFGKKQKEYTLPEDDPAAQ
jgi:phospholipid/cholesterol/gamma-HCH transport system substrate-binding protein